MSNNLSRLTIFLIKGDGIMEEYIQEKKKYTIDNQEYTVIVRSKKENNCTEIYNILSRYALQELQTNIRQQYRLWVAFYNIIMYNVIIKGWLLSFKVERRATKYAKWKI